MAAPLKKNTSTIKLLIEDPEFRQFITNVIRDVSESSLVSKERKKKVIEKLSKVEVALQEDARGFTENEPHVISELPQEHGEAVDHTALDDLDEVDLATIEKLEKKGVKVIFPNLKYRKPKYNRVNEMMKYVESDHGSGEGVKLVIMNFND